nr:reverse transcriptase domain-containing protein [Tanacetum cinerariifolium]
MADRTMEELLQAPTEGYREAIVIPEILAENFEIKTNLLQACPHHGFSELTQIDKFYNGLTEQDQDSLNAASGGNLLNKTTREALQIIENKSKVRYSRSKSNVSRVNTNSRDVVSKTDDRIDKLADQIFNLVEIVNRQVITPAKAVEKTCVTCGGAHAYYECIATDSNPSSVCAATGSYNQVSPPNRASNQILPHGFAPGNNFMGNNFQNNKGYRAQMNNVSNFQNQGFQNQPISVPNNQIPPSVPNELSSYIKSNEIAIKTMQNQINVLRGDFSKQEENLRRNLNDDIKNIFSFFQNQPSTSGTLPSNFIPNPKGEMKAVTTRSGLAYERPSIPTECPLEKVDEQNTKKILDKEHSNSSGSTAQVQPLVVPISIPEPDVARTQSKPSIPYPSSFADALLLMPKFASTIKSLLANKDKLFELANVPLNENCSAMLLKKLSEKIGDPGKFLIPCDFIRMEVCHALADLGASINLIPLSIWKKLSLPELTPTRMTLELADMSITHPKGVVEDVFVKVGKFHFLTDFVVVDFKADPRVPLILGRSFLRTGRALIDVYGEKITLMVNDESITFNLDQVMRYSDNSVSRVNVINIASEEVIHYNTKSSNPTLVSKSDFCEDPIVKTSPFGESDFFSEEIENCLKDDSIPIDIENSVFDLEGDILLIEKLLKEDPFRLPPMNLNQAKYPIEEPEYSFSMGYEHFITTPVTELDEVTESSAKNLEPIPREYEDDFTIHDEDVPIEESKVYSSPLFDDDEINSDELESHVEPNFVESNFVESLSNHDTVKFDHLEEFSGALMPIHIAEEERIRREHAEYIRLMEREEIDIVTNTDELLPSGFENDDSEEEIYVLEELRVDNPIPRYENELSDFHQDNNPSFSRPPSEPPDDEFDFELNSREVISAVINNNDELECFDPGGEINVSINVEDDDYFPFTLVIHIFLPYLFYPEVFLLLLSAESEDTIFDPGIFV